MERSSIKFGSSITNLADDDGCTVQAVPNVYTGVAPAVCDAIILLCHTAVGVTVS